MWDDAWKWVIDHHLYNTAVLLFIVGFVINALLRLKGVQKFLGKYKKLKVGAAGIELELKDGDSEKDLQQDGILNYIKDELKKIIGRLDVHYGYIKEAAIQAGNSVVWSDKGAPFVEVIKAGLLNIKLGANGNLKHRMVEVIVGFGKEGIPIYRSILNEFIKNSKGTLSAQFYETIEWIDQRLL